MPRTQEGVVVRVLILPAYFKSPASQRGLIIQKSKLYLSKHIKLYTVQASAFLLYLNYTSIKK